MKVTRKTPRPATLADRAARVARVVERFRGKPFCWHGANCWKLVGALARALGHPFPPVPRFRSALGVKAALRKAGCDNAEQLLDRHFTRLPAPAFARVGDLVLLPDAADGKVLLGAVCLADGQGNLFGWHGADEDDSVGFTSVKFAMGDAVGAWAVGR